MAPSQIGLNISFNIKILAEAYEWDTLPNIHDKPVGFQEAKKNIHVIGGRVARCKGDHFNVVFEGGRTWTLTLRDPVPPPFLDELVPITHYRLSGKSLQKTCQVFKT